MKKAILMLPVAIALMGAGPSSCTAEPSTDMVQRMAQEKTIQEANAQVGMPEIVNFQEKRMMKTLYELRDKNIATHAYIVNQMQGCLVYLGPAIGYGMPYATQYSNPEKVVYAGGYQEGFGAIPQAEPNGLFMPADAHGTWVMLKDPASSDVKPVYIEPDVIVSPFRLTARECR